MLRTATAIITLKK